MKYSLSNTLDRVRKTVEMYTRTKPADDTSLKQNEGSAVELEDIQLALQELRHLVLESKTFEITASADFPADQEVLPPLMEVNENAQLAKMRMSA